MSNRLKIGRQLEQGLENQIVVVDASGNQKYDTLANLFNIDYTAGDSDYKVNFNSIEIDTFPVVNFLTSLSISGNTLTYIDESNTSNDIVLSSGGANNGLFLNGGISQLGAETQNEATSAFTANRFVNLDDFNLDFEGTAGNNNPAFRIQSDGDIWAGANGATGAVSSTEGVMFFDKSKYSFVGGRVNSAAAITSVGLRNFLWGHNISATSNGNALFGASNGISGSIGGNLGAGTGNTIAGDYNISVGFNCDIIGSNNASFGSEAKPTGNFNFLSGQSITVIGNNNSSTGGANVSVTGNGNITHGSNLSLTGGNNAIFATDSNFATGFGSSGVFGAGHNASGINDRLLITGSGHTFTGLNNFTFTSGEANTINNAVAALVSGSNIDINLASSGRDILAFGSNVSVTKEKSATIGWGTPTYKLINNGINGIHFSSKTNQAIDINDGLHSELGTIIGGLNHNLPSGFTRSAIIAGNQIRPVTVKEDMVYLPNLSLWNTPENVGTAAGTYKLLFRDPAAEGQVKTVDITLPINAPLWQADANGMIPSSGITRIGLGVATQSNRSIRTSGNVDFNGLIMGVSGGATIMNANTGNLNITNFASGGTVNFLATNASNATSSFFTYSPTATAVIISANTAINAPGQSGAAAASLHVRSDGLSDNTRALLIENSAGVDILSVADNGFMAIGDNLTPTARLHVNGSMRFEGLLTTPTAGALLTSIDTSGNLNWTPQGSGSNVNWRDNDLTLTETRTHNIDTFDHKISSTSDANHVFYDASSGNTGFGRINPLAKVHVQAEHSLLALRQNTATPNANTYSLNIDNKGQTGNLDTSGPLYVDLLNGPAMFIDGNGITNLFAQGATTAQHEIVRYKDLNEDVFYEASSGVNGDIITNHAHNVMHAADGFGNGYDTVNATPYVRRNAFEIHNATTVGQFLHIEFDIVLDTTSIELFCDLKGKMAGLDGTDFDVMIDAKPFTRMNDTTVTKTAGNSDIANHLFTWYIKDTAGVKSPVLRVSNTHGDVFKALIYGDIYKGSDVKSATEAVPKVKQIIVSNNATE